MLAALPLLGCLDVGGWVVGMLLTRDIWIDRVLRVLNELGWDDASSVSFIGSDTTEVSAYAVSFWRDAWRKGLELLPKSLYLVRDITNEVEIRHVRSEGVGYVLVPSDFYRLSSFRLHGWKATVLEAVERTEAVMRRQENEYTRGGVTRPVCVLDSRPAVGGEWRMYYYSLPKGMAASVEDFRYIPLAGELDGGGIEVDDRLVSPLSYICGSLIYTVFEKPEAAAGLLALAAGG